MALRQGSTAHLEQEFDKQQRLVPQAVRLLLTAGVYYLDTGAGSAFLKDSAGTFVLDDDSAAEDRVMFLFGSSTVMV